MTDQDKQQYSLLEGGSSNTPLKRQTVHVSAIAANEVATRILAEDGMEGIFEREANHASVRRAVARASEPATPEELRADLASASHDLSAASGFACRSTSDEELLHDGATIPNLSGSFRVYIDWLQGTGSYEDFGALRELVDFFVSLCGGDLIDWSSPQPFFKGIKWNSSVQSTRGIFFAWNPPAKDESLGTFWISFPGSVCALLALADIWVIVDSLRNDYKFRATRFDAYIDDFKSRLSYDQIISAARARNVAGFRSPCVPIAPIALLNSSHANYQNPGWTIYFGAKRKKLRFYDKFVESKGEINAIRMELQLREVNAAHIVERFLELPNPSEFLDEFNHRVKRFLAGLVSDAIDFVVVDSGDRYSRRDRLGWWQVFLDALNVEPCYTSPPAVPPCPILKIRWMFKQVSKSLFQLEKIFGDGFWDLIEDIFHVASFKMNKANWNLIQVAKQDFPEGYDSSLMLLSGLPQELLSGT